MASSKHTQEETERFRKAAAGCAKSRNEVVELNLGLVGRLAIYYGRRNPTMEMQDLIQSGRLGLVEAVERFDVDRGYKFSTYANQWIRKHIQKFVARNYTRAWHSSVSLTEDYFAGRLEGDTLAEYESMMGSLSLDVTVGEDSPLNAGVPVTLGDLVPDGESDNPIEEEIAGGVDHGHLYFAIACLPADLIEVVSLHYGLADEHLDRKDIAKRLGTSVGRVTRMLNEAHELLRERLEPSD